MIGKIKLKLEKETQREGFFLKLPYIQHKNSFLLTDHFYIFLSPGEGKLQCKGQSKIISPPSTSELSYKFYS